MTSCSTTFFLIDTLLIATMVDHNADDVINGNGSNVPFNSYSDPLTWVFVAILSVCLGLLFSWSIYTIYWRRRWMGLMARPNPNLAPKHDGSRPNGIELQEMNIDGRSNHAREQRPLSTVVEEESGTTER